MMFKIHMFRKRIFFFRINVDWEFSIEIVNFDPLANQGVPPLVLFHVIILDRPTLKFF